MNTASLPKTAVGSARDFLEVLRRSDVIPVRRVDEIGERVRSGRYPDDAFALAGKLVKKEVLTSYQARRLLHGQADGLVAGRYILLDRLGRGAMGKVYKARHRRLNRVVAIKTVFGGAEPAELLRFLQEAESIAQLQHPQQQHQEQADQPRWPEPE